MTRYSGSPILGRAIASLQLLRSIIEYLNLRANPVLFFDVGCRGGLSKSWGLLSYAGPLNLVFVEHNPIEAETIRAKYGAQSGYSNWS
jgi:hypothetical protein